jgi:uncharacterized phiE125 gp8 family phage protein
VAEPLSLDGAKAHLKITSSDEDTSISSMIADARRCIEGRTGLVLTPRQVEECFDSLPEVLALSSWPIRTIVSISYVDPNGADQSIASGQYRASIKKRPARLTAAVNSVWPFVAAVPSAVTVTVDAGYANPADVPETIIRAMKLLVGHYYSNREAVVSGERAVAVELPMAVETLLFEFIRWTS